MVEHGKRRVGAVLSLYPTPFVLCGTYDEDDRPNIAALAWVGVCCSVPPAVQISLRKERHTYEAIRKRRAFSVCLPSTEQASLADYCGLVSGRTVDKFAKTGLTPQRGELVDAPIVLEFPISMECRLLHVLEIGSHDLFVGEVMTTWVDESCLEADGAINPSKVKPIAFAPGDGLYYSLGGSVAKSFNAGKAFLGGDS